MRRYLIAAALFPISMMAACECADCCGGGVSDERVAPMATDNGNTMALTSGSGTAAPAQSGDAMGGPRVAAATPRPGTVNVYCPLMPEHKVFGGQGNARWSADYKGKSVGFCCEDCVDAWKEMTDAQRDEALKAAVAKNGM